MWLDAHLLASCLSVVEINGKSEENEKEIESAKR